MSKMDRMEKIAVLILILVYIFSVIGAWYCTRWNYINLWDGQKNPNVFNIVLIFVPVINTLYCIIWIMQQAWSANTSEIFYIKRI